MAANVVAPANALVNLSPSKFTFRSKALVTALLGIAFRPWRLLKPSESFVYTLLVRYSALLGPIGGIALAHYYLLKRKTLSLNDLYSMSPNGAYYYTKGYNLAALFALVVGILPIIPGFLEKVGILSSVSDTFVVIYNNAWFFSFFTAGFPYILKKYKINTLCLQSICKVFSEYTSYISIIYFPQTTVQYKTTRAFFFFFSIEEIVFRQQCLPYFCRLLRMTGDNNQATDRFV